MLESMKVENQLGPTMAHRRIGAQLAPGHAFEVPEILFAKINGRTAR